MASMNNKIVEFFVCWLSAAAYHAWDRMKTGDDVKRFVSEAWDNYDKGGAAAGFGKGWK